MADEETNAHKYRLRVTAGPEYDPNTHQVVPVNGETLRIENDHAIISLCVRIQDYTGNKHPLPLLPPKSKPLPKQASRRAQHLQAHISNIHYTQKTSTQYPSQ